MSCRIKLLLTDFDRVLTDGSFCYAENGNITKRFHVHDGIGPELLREIRAVKASLYYYLGIINK